MSALGSTIFLIFFGILLLGNLACQIYVATKVFSGAQVIRGIIRGNRTFIHGWKRANELGIKDIMIFWSILLASLLFMLCSGVLIIGVSRPPQAKQSNQTNIITHSIMEVHAKALEAQEKNPSVTINIKVYVAEKPIKKGEPFKASYIGETTMPVRESPPDQVIVEEELYGKLAAVDIEPGQLIVHSMLMEGGPPSWSYKDE